MNIHMEWYTQQEGERHLNSKGRGKSARDSGRARTRSIERAFVAAAVCAFLSIKLYVSFAEYRLFYRSLLQKRPKILSILLHKATP